MSPRDPRDHHASTSTAAPSRRRRAIRIGVGLLVLAAVALVGARVANLWYLGRIGWYSGDWTEHEANAERGFDWPYRMYVPESVLDGEGPVRILVRPNNTGTGPDDDFEVHHADAAHLLEVSRREAERLRAVVLVPSFPRPGSDRTSWGTQVLDARTIRRERPMGSFDLQLLAMIDDAQARLRGHGMRVCPRVLMDGFSASAMFTSRFVMIHPERVEAAAMGAPGGWPMVPRAEHEGAALAYPAGVADYSERFGRSVPAEVAHGVSMLFYLGGRDDNDAVPYEDSFPPAVAEVVWGRFGETPVARWDDAEAAFEGFDATFRTYPELGHEAPRSVRDDVLEFFAAHDDRSACELEATTAAEAPSRPSAESPSVTPPEPAPDPEPEPEATQGSEPTSGPDEAPSPADEPCEGERLLRGECTCAFRQCSDLCCPEGWICIHPYRPGGASKCRRPLR